MKAVFSMLTLFSLCIWYYVLYTILLAVHPDRLVWFLFWVYLPLGLLLRVMEKLLEKEDK